MKNKGFVSIILLSSVLFLMAVALSYSTIIIKKQAKKVREQIEKKDFSDLVIAYQTYVEDHYNKLIKGITNGLNTSTRIFPNKLSDLISDGYLKNSNFRICNNSNCVTDLYYKGSPVIYFKSKLAENECNFCIENNTSGFDINSGFAVIIFQSTNFTSNIDSDPIYSQIKNLVESAETAEDFDFNQLKNIYGINPDNLHADDLYVAITAQDEANDFKQRLLANAAAYAQNAYAKFRDNLLEILGNMATTKAVAMKMLLSDQNFAKDVCKYTLAKTFETSSDNVFFDYDNGELYLGSCGVLTNLTNSSTDDFLAFLLVDFKSREICMVAKCVLVSADGKKATPISEISIWPANEYATMDLRISIDFSDWPTDSNSACPFRAN